MKDWAKQVAKYYNQCKLPKWATVLGVVLLVFGIVAAIETQKELTFVLSIIVVILANTWAKKKDK